VRLLISLFAAAPGFVKLRRPRLPPLRPRCGCSYPPTSDERIAALEAYVNNAIRENRSRVSPVRP